MQIHQILPCLRHGDAIGNHTLEIQRILRQWGYESLIFADDIHDDMRPFAKSYKKLKGRHLEDALILYHFSVGSAVSEVVRAIPNKKILIYHNITPPEFLRGYDDFIRDILAKGREELKRFSNLCDLALGDSEFNRLELEELGFKETGVLPIIVDFEKYTAAPDPNILKQYQDEQKNIIFVGRIVPNKCQEDLLLAFYFYQHYINSRSRLFLIGMNGIERYDVMLEKLVEHLHLENVHITGRISDEALAAYYQCADLLLCMSEHEGFLVPLLEAMHLNIPILAYNAASVPYTLEDAGVLINEKRFEEVAEMMDLLMTDPALRDPILAEQRQRLKFFQKSRLEGILHTALERVVPLRT